MDLEDLEELQYITPMANVPSIGRSGILSHDRADRVGHESVAAQEIQDRRAKVRVPQGLRLHQYANLYICARNPMMFKRLGERDTLCVLRLSTDVLELAGVVVTDRNASSDYVRFAAAPAGLAIVDKDLTFADDWRHPNPYEYFRRKSAKCAEVLVPHAVPSRYIAGVRVMNAAAKGRFEELELGLEVTIDGHLFFN